MDEVLDDCRSHSDEQSHGNHEVRSRGTVELASEGPGDRSRVQSLDTLAGLWKKSV